MFLGAIERVRRELVGMVGGLTGGGDGPATQTFHTVLVKAMEEATRQESTTGEKGHPFDYKNASKFLITNSRHSACIFAKANAITGLGFKNKATKKALSKISKARFHQMLRKATLDFVQVGNGYFEVCFPESDASSRLIGDIAYAPAGQITVFVDDLRGNYHYVMRQETGQEVYFARFGERERLQDLRKLPKAPNELIRIEQPTNMARWFGFPDWLAAVVQIELDRLSKQHAYDYYLNRGVPELLLFLFGARFSKKTREEFQDQLKGHIGTGNSRKTGWLELPFESKAQVEKIGLGVGEESASPAIWEALATEIVSAHRVPPLLAGIQIPGKLGASNEMVQAIWAFQILVIAQFQEDFQEELGATLGDSELAEGVGLGPEDFEFKTLLEEVDMGLMDTAARMRESPQEAKAKGRDLGEGVKS